MDIKENLYTFLKIINNNKVMKRIKYSIVK